MSTGTDYLAKPILDWLRERADDSLAGRKYREAADEIERLRNRLELYGTTGSGERVLLDESCDGIACRDETIAMLDALRRTDQPAAATDDALDAARYRWLRQGWEKCGLHVLLPNGSYEETWPSISGIEMDQVISGRMTADQQTSPQPKAARSTICDECGCVYGAHRDHCSKADQQSECHHDYGYGGKCVVCGDVRYAFKADEAADKT
jgi:hypothetical protein